MLNKLKKFVQLLISDQSLIYKFLKNIFKKESNKIFHRSIKLIYLMIY